MDRAFIVVGLGFGDCGKGTIVDTLVHKTCAPLVVRFSGGAQAAHHVVAPEGKIHCFSQWGSGTLHGAQTHLTADVVIDPLAMRPEASALESFGIHPWTMTTVDPNALVVTPDQRLLNQLREKARGNQKHGSCGRGIGETVDDDEHFDLGVIASWLRDPGILRAKLSDIRDHKYHQAVSLGMKDEFLDQCDEFDDIIASYRDIPLVCRETSQVLPRHSTVVFEGAQGVLIGQEHGFFPHTTRSNTTQLNALKLLNGCDQTVIGVTRTYMTRHGAGPFPTEDPNFTVFKHEHNGSHEYAGNFRLGPMDRTLLQYAIDAVNPDLLAVTHLDVDPKVISSQYDTLSLKLHDLEHNEQLGQRLSNFKPQLIHGVSLKDYVRTPVGIESFGPTWMDKKFTELWRY